MFGTDMAVFQLAAFFDREREYALGLGRKMQLHRLRNTLFQGDSLLDFAAHGFDRQTIAKREKPRRKSFVFTHQAEQNMFGRNDLRAVLESFVTGKKDDASRLFRIAFKHKK